MTTNVRAAFSNLSPMQKFMGGAAIALASVFSAQAHVPAADSEQGKLLAPFSDFVMQMKNNQGSSCCNLRDGRGDLEEKITKAGKYQVKITHDLAGNKLATPKWLEIDEDRILSAKHAKKVCDEVKSDTCKSPPFNVIWYTDAGHVYCYFPRPPVM